MKKEPEEIDEIALWLESQPTHNEKMADSMTQILQMNFPGIKELSVTYDNGFNIKFNDDRYDFSEVYRVVRETLIFK